jgi:hypothetical protein
MTTGLTYRLGISTEASGSVFGRPIRPGRSTYDEVLIASGTTEEMLAHTRAMHQLAALSGDSSSLDRTLEDEINRSAWGFSEE